MENYNKNGSCLVTLVLFLAFMTAAATAGYLFLNTLPPISRLKDYQPSLVSQVVASDGTVIKTFGAFRYKKVTIDEIPDNLKKAVIAIEDKNFYKHRGFDPAALVRSVFSNILAGRVVQGASTITQQLARILFLSSEKTMDRKLKELIIAYRLEKTLPKDEILQMYLNNVYLGEGAYGAAAAAEIYFNKRVNNLTLDEAALIAGLPQAPSIYSPYQSVKLAKARRHQVLERMLKMGFITKKELVNADNAFIVLNPTHKPYSLNKAPYFINYILKELDEKAGITEQEVIQGGYKVYTTLNYDDQLAAQNAISKNLAAWGMSKPYQQGALFSFEANTGKILAYVGGKDYAESQFDRVTQAIRPPGSSFKPFVYAVAMEKGMTPKTVYEDAPFSIAKWQPRNYGGKYRGKMPLIKALAFSSNVIAARLIKDVGVLETINMAKRLGISTPLAHDATIALGSSGVKLIDMTTAYGVFANGGLKIEPYGVERVETPGGRIIYQGNPSAVRVLDSKTVANMVEMMKQVIKIGTGRAANIGRFAAGKTGTTDNYRDAWFVGFTPEIVTGVWVGNDNNTPTPNLTGGTVPAIAWRSYMKTAVAKTAPNDFYYPDVVVLDQNSGGQQDTSYDSGNYDTTNGQYYDANSLDVPTETYAEGDNPAQSGANKNNPNNSPPIPVPSGGQSSQNIDTGSSAPPLPEEQGYNENSGY